MKKKKIIKNKKYKFVTEVKKLPNGMFKEFQIIKHPGAVCIVPFLSPRKVIMLRQYRAALGRYFYEFPAGTLEKNEEKLSCAKRELIEEAGYAAKKFEYLGKIAPVPGYADEIIHIYQAFNLSPAYAPGDEDEIIEVIPMSVGQIRELFTQKKIIDAKTIAALAFTKIL